MYLGDQRIKPPRGSLLLLDKQSVNYPTSNSAQTSPRCVFECHFHLQIVDFINFSGELSLSLMYCHISSISRAKCVFHTNRMDFSKRRCTFQATFKVLDHIVAVVLEENGKSAWFTVWLSKSG